MTLHKYHEYSNVVNQINQAVKHNRVNHAYIIEGDRCVDKLGFAKEFTKAILCKENPGIGCDNCVICNKVDHDNYEDLFYAEADELSLKNAVIMNMQEKLKVKPIGERNIAVIIGADSMTVRAQNRLLKTLEEPNPGTVIILLSENTDNLLPTIRSRCVTYRLGGFDVSLSDESMAFPSKIMELIFDNAYFSDIKGELTKGITNRESAHLFLDGMERLMSQYLIEEKDRRIKKEKVIRNVMFIEEARKDLLANVNYKYAIRNLILKIGG